MNRTGVKKDKNVNAEGEVYLSKRILLRAAKKGIKAAADETMKVMGYNVIAENGWVVKVYADGRREQIKEIPKVARPEKIILS
jgi:hypothetical protein